MDTICIVKGYSDHCKSYGVFAAHDLPKDFEYYNNQTTDKILTLNKDQYNLLQKIDPQMAARYTHFGFYMEKEDVIGLDLGIPRFMNHSSEPNCQFKGDDIHAAVTIRDIKKGEELFEDYRNYCNSPWARMYPDMDLSKLHEYK